MIVKIWRVVIGLIIFILPIQTVWILQERIIQGEKWQYGTLMIPMIELFLWGVILFHYRVFSAVSWKSYWPIGILYGYGVLRAVFSLEPAIALQQIRFFFVPFLVAGLFFIAKKYISPKQILTLLFGSATVIAVGAIIQFFLQTSFSSVLLGISAHSPEVAGSSVVVSETERWLRSYGLFAHPNIFGGYLLVMITLAFVWFLKEQNRTKKFRALVSGGILFQTAALVTTFSRSAWIGLILSIGMSLILYKDFYQRYIRQVGTVLVHMLLMSILFMSFFPAATSARLFGGSTNELASTTERLDGYAEAREIIYMHPWFGVGPGNYTAALMIAFPNRPLWVYQPVHNTDLLFVAEWGIVGVLFFLFILWTYKEQIFSVSLKRALISIAVLLVPGLVDHYLLSTYSGLLIIGMALAGFWMLFPEETLSTKLSPKA